MKYVAFDTETTGLHDTAKIVEIAGIKWNEYGTLGIFSMLINPEIPIPQDAEKVHGINDLMVSGAEVSANVLFQFFVFCGGCHLVGHFPEYDFKRIYYELENFLDEKQARPLFWYLDTKRIAKEKLPDFPPGYSLNALTKHYGISKDQKHRALDDAILVKELFERLTDGMEKEDLKKYTESTERFLPTKKSNKKIWTPNI